MKTKVHIGQGSHTVHIDTGSEMLLLPPWIVMKERLKVHKYRLQIFIHRVAGCTRIPGWTLARVKIRGVEDNVPFVVSSRQGDLSGILLGMPALIKLKFAV